MNYLQNIYIYQISSYKTGKWYSRWTNFTFRTSKTERRVYGLRAVGYYPCFLIVHAGLSNNFGRVVFFQHGNCTHWDFGRTNGHLFEQWRCRYVNLANIPSAFLFSYYQMFFKIFYLLFGYFSFNWINYFVAMGGFIFIGIVIWISDSRNNTR